VDNPEKLTTYRAHKTKKKHNMCRTPPHTNTHKQRKQGMCLPTNNWRKIHHN